MFGLRTAFQSCADVCELEINAVRLAAMIAADGGAHLDAFDRTTTSFCKFLND